MVMRPWRTRTAVRLARAALVRPSVARQAVRVWGPSLRKSSRAARRRAAMARELLPVGTGVHGRAGLGCAVG